MVDTATLQRLQKDVTECRRCPRLVAWREQVAREKRRAYRNDEYWGRPLPGFGDPEARLLLVGLAPAAHGGNRTGRVFTGDRSADALFIGLHAAGFANQTTSRRRDDGLQLHDAYITAAARCAPPANKPLPEELAACQPWLEQELALLSNVRLVVPLGGIAFAAFLRAAAALGRPAPRPRPPFGHALEYSFWANGPRILTCYHPSQQNTQTGRLTQEMLNRVFVRAREMLDTPEPAAARST